VSAPLEFPPGYRAEHDAGLHFVVLREAELALARAGYAPRGGGPLAVSALSGRAPLYELAHGREVFLVRRFTHGGLLRFFTGRRFRDALRPARELVLADALARAGIATPVVVAACARRAPLWGWELELVTRRIDGTLDLGHVLRAARDGEVPPQRLRLVCAALGALVRRLHEQRFVHADLTPNNVLVQRAALADEDPKLAILDLDRSRFAATELDDPTRRANLRRLLRFVERREVRDGRVLSRTDYARFFLAYDPAGTRWKADWRAIRAEQARMRPWHEAGWLLERLFARRVDPRSRSRADHLASGRGF
jgi:hypothetical protein